MKFFLAILSIGIAFLGFAAAERKVNNTNPNNKRKGDRLNLLGKGAVR